MSIKIYRAYELLDLSQLHTVLWRIQDRCHARMRKLLAEHYWDLVVGMSRDESTVHSSMGVRLNMARAVIRDGYAASLAKPNQDTYSLDVKLNIYPHSRGVALRAFYEPASLFRDVLDFLGGDPDLADFHYQNQSHPQPDGISDAEWERRRLTWEEIASSWKDIGRHLTLDIMSWSVFRLIDPWWEVCDQWRDRPVPTPEQAWAHQLNEIKGVTAVASDGRITCEPSKVAILRIGYQWIVYLSPTSFRPFDNLRLAAEYLYLELLPETERAFVKRMLERRQEK